MKAIDMHTHAFPDGLAGRAISSLEAGCPWKAVGDGTIAGLLRSMDGAGVAVSVVCAIATRPGQAEGILKWCVSVRSERIVPLASVHPQTPDAPGWIRRIAAEGLAGIKLHPMYQDFRFDDELALPLLAAAEECGLLVTAHCGRDIAFPPEDDRAVPHRVARVIERHPLLRLVCTHLGGWRAWQEVERHLIGRPVHLETSFSLAQTGRERATDLIRRHGPQRVMMGSDWPWNCQQAERSLIELLPLTPQERQAVLWSNAARLLGLDG